jgi:hypothetical protein
MMFPRRHLMTVMTAMSIAMTVSTTAMSMAMVMVMVTVGMVMVTAARVTTLSAAVRAVRPVLWLQRLRSPPSLRSRRLRRGD